MALRRASTCQSCLQSRPGVQEGLVSAELVLSKVSCWGSIRLVQTAVGFPHQKRGRPLSV